MKLRSIALVFALLFARNAMAQTGPLRVFASNGVKGVMDGLVTQCERAIGRPLAIEFNTSASIKRKIESGEAFDVALLTSDTMDDLVKAGKIADAGRASLGRSGIGVGI